jgi:hypothetical protein
MRTYGSPTLIGFVDILRSNLRKLNELKFREKWQVKSSNKFAALENFNGSGNTNRLRNGLQSQVKQA